MRNRRPYRAAALAFVALPAVFAADRAVAQLGGLQATNDSSWVYYQAQHGGAPAFVRTYIDTDRRSVTGFATGGIGADYLIENGSLYRHASAGWNWTFVKPVTFSDGNGTARWQVARADLAEAASPNDADLVFQVEAPLQTSARLTHTYSDAGGGSGGTTVTYPPTTAHFANPERGLYHHTGDCDQDAFSATALRGYRTREGISLVMCVFYLGEFKTRPISAAALARFQQQMDTVRAAGLKAIVRFGYTQSTSGDDAARDRVLAHLDQLAPYLQRNADVIAVVQAGLIGAWGEWYYTRNFGDAGRISAADWANRKAVVDKLLASLPAARSVQLRTPKFKRRLYGEAPLPPDQAGNGSANARLGHHNDCFLASASDMGTYVDRNVEYPYLEAETRYLPMGGETCAVNPPRSACTTALSEMRRFHWSYLNVDYHPSVLQGWSSGGCLPAVRLQLGYRLVLQSGTYPDVVARGGELAFGITLRNEGWAAPFNPRGVELVLRRASGPGTYRFPLAAAPSRWLPGAAVTLQQRVTLPADMPADSYALFLSLPDPAPTLAGRPEYSVRLANAGLWEASTGFNDLRQVVMVVP